MSVPPQRGFRQGPGGPGPRPPQGPPLLSDQDARRIIVEGDAELLVEKAQALAERSNASRTSIRRLYGEVLRIDMLWRDEARAAQAQRRAVLFKPRLAYQAGRVPNLREVKDNLDRLLAHTQGRREHFRRFQEFFEALVAYLPR